MPSFTGGNLGLTWGFVLHEDGWGDSYNLDFQRLDALVHLSILDILDTPPGSPAVEDRYIVGATPTGAWVGNTNKVAVWTKKEDPDSRAWVFYTPKVGWRAWRADDSDYIRFNGSAWVDDSAAAGAQAIVDAVLEVTSPENNDVLVYDSVAAKVINVRPMRAISFGSDPTTVLSASQELFYHRFSFPFTILADFIDYRGASTTIGGTAVATAATVLRVQRALTAAPLTFADVGTITIGIGTVNISAKSSSAVDIDFAKGDIIRILAPVSPDATLKGVYGTLIGFES